MNIMQAAEPVYFDLDGTLADSAAGIVASLERALAVCGITVTIDWQHFIGPPLQQMLNSALPGLTPDQSAAIVAAYREHYATTGAFMTTPFPGVKELLSATAARGAAVFVVTNKPQQPAEVMIRHMKLDGFIRRVVGGDPAGLGTKSDRAQALMAEESLAGGCFVGDGLDDLLAAERIGARFLLAGWGYGAGKVLSERPDVERLERPEDMLRKSVL